MRTQMLSDPSVSSKLRSVDELIVGNWMNDSFNSALGKYDTILADYLIGAVDGFSPYEQDTIIKRLQDHLTPSGRMYFIGMNPIPDEKNPPGNIISEIRRARDACILLAGHRTYREFPSSWMKRHIEAAGMRVVGISNFTILHSEESALRQIRVAKSKLDYMVDANLRNGMERYLLDLEERTRVAIRKNDGRIPLSFDYIIAAENATEENAGIVVDESTTVSQEALPPTHEHQADDSSETTLPPTAPVNDDSKDIGICGTS